MKKLAIILCLTLFTACKSKKVVTTQIPLETTIEDSVAADDESKLEEKDVDKEVENGKVDFIKIAPTSANAMQKNKAYDLGKRILMTCNTSKFKPFTTDEATNSVINNITIDKLSTICNRYRRYYGTFEDIELIEVLKNPQTSTTVYRYKALYSKAVANKELRMTMNSANKVSSIRTMDWENDF